MHRYQTRGHEQFITGGSAVGYIIDPTEQVEFLATSRAGKRNNVIIGGHMNKKAIEHFTSTSAALGKPETDYIPLMGSTSACNNNNISGTANNYATAKSCVYQHDKGLYSGDHNINTMNLRCSVCQDFGSLEPGDKCHQARIYSYLPISTEHPPRTIIMYSGSCWQAMQGSRDVDPNALISQCYNKVDSYYDSNSQLSGSTLQYDQLWYTEVSGNAIVRLARASDSARGQTYAAPVIFDTENLNIFTIASDESHMRYEPPADFYFRNVDSADSAAKLPVVANPKLAGKQSRDAQAIVVPPVVYGIWATAMQQTDKDFTNIQSAKWILVGGILFNKTLGFGNYTSDAQYDESKYSISAYSDRESYGIGPIRLDTTANYQYIVQRVISWDAYRALGCSAKSKYTFSTNAGDTVNLPAQYPWMYGPFNAATNGGGKFAPWDGKSIDCTGGARLGSEMVDPAANCSKFSQQICKDAKRAPRPLDKLNVSANNPLDIMCYPDFYST